VIVTVGGVGLGLDAKDLSIPLQSCFERVNPLTLGLKFALLVLYLRRESFRILNCPNVGRICSRQVRFDCGFAIRMRPSGCRVV
jgi:hypothetical protein